MVHSPIPFRWPDPPFQVVLVEPDIPPNTGSIGRLCAATGSWLHLVGPLGFRLTDRAVRRAGLDYWDAVTILRHPHFEAFLESLNPAQHVLLFSTRGQRSYLHADYRPGDALVFGNEHRGLPESLLETFREQTYGIPIQTQNVRCLNLANAVSIVLYEALRQVQGIHPPSIVSDAHHPG